MWPRLTWRCTTMHYGCLMDVTFYRVQSGVKPWIQAHQFRTLSVFLHCATLTRVSACGEVSRAEFSRSDDKTVWDWTFPHNEASSALHLSQGSLRDVLFAAWELYYDTDTDSQNRLLMDVPRAYSLLCAYFTEASIICLYCNPWNWQWKEDNLSACDIQQFNSL